MAASRSQLSRHLQDRPLVERTGQLTSEAEREELRVALVATQESVAVQILLEACLETDKDRVCMELYLIHLYEVRSKNLGMEFIITKQ